MKKVQQFLPKVYRDVLADPAAEEDLVLSYWPETVGRLIAHRTRPLGIFGDKLFVEVTDSSWLDQLRGLSWRITRQLNEVIGKRVLTDVRFRMGRAHAKPPARAMSASGNESLPRDEADEIRDPNLRRIFRIHRKAAGDVSGS